MKIAIPTRSNKVDEHFGHCEYYTIFTVLENKIINQEILPSPVGCGCKSNIGAILQEQGVTAMLAGNMGGGALNILNHHGIEVYRGCSGDVTQLIEMFLEGTVKDSGVGCSSHSDSNDCGHY